MLPECANSTRVCALYECGMYYVHVHLYACRHVSAACDASVRMCKCVQV